MDGQFVSYLVIWYYFSQCGILGSPVLDLFGGGRRRTECIDESSDLLGNRDCLKGPLVMEGDSENLH